MEGMIRQLEVSNFRMLARNRVSLDQFHVLVGPNATGKSTFLDALQFISDVLSRGVAAAVEERTPNFFELCFDPDFPIAFAVELEARPEVEGAVKPTSPSHLRYEIEVGVHTDDGLRVLREQLFILSRDSFQIQPSLFGGDVWFEIIHKASESGWRKVVSKTAEGSDYFQDERTKWNNTFRFGVDRPALGSLPEDPARFPLSIAARNLLRTGVRSLALDARRMRAPASPGGSAVPALDGGNLPYQARALKRRDPVLFGEWVRHVATGVRGLLDVDVWEREEDKNLVLQATFAGDHPEPVPSWFLSDGTLRLMALTLLSYLGPTNAGEIYLIEEPENGLHPLAVQTAYEALSRPPEDTQLFFATHSPIFLAHVDLQDVLVFRRSRDGAAIVRHGIEVPELKTWQGRANIAELFASGVLS